VSFLETGRAQPTRDMILRIAATLAVPLRDQNAMLRAAGFPEAFDEPSFDSGISPAVARAIERMLKAHEPYPMTVMDRRYDVLRMNRAGVALFTRFIAEPSALPSRVNAFGALFDPRLLRPFVVEWDRVAHAFLVRLHRHALTRPDNAALGELLRSLFEYPGVPESWRQPDFSVPSEPVLTLRVRRGDLELAFLTTLTVFNAPQNVTLEEIAIESYFPLDDATESACRRVVEP
jgi:hypothetical protein